MASQEMAVLNGFNVIYGLVEFLSFCSNSDSKSSNNTYLKRERARERNNNKFVQKTIKLTLRVPVGLIT